jgi:hypothetical protein
VNAVHALGFVTLVLARAILLDALGNARHAIDRSEHGRELAHRDLSAPECLDDGIERHLRVVGAADVRQRERERPARRIAALARLEFHGSSSSGYFRVFEVILVGPKRYRSEISNDLQAVGINRWTYSLPIQFAFI